MQKATKDLGIWMDHSNAYLTEFTRDPMSTKTISSAFTHNDKVSSMIKSESLSHNKEQHGQHDFYKVIGESIANFDRVVLFGPTLAKKELHNILKEDHHFDKIMITVENADKMTEHEQQLFVKNHFSNK